MKKINRNNIAWSACALTFLLLFSSCSKDSGGNNKEKKSAVKDEGIFKVNTAVVAGKTVQRTVEATGTLASWDEVTVGNEVPGTVDRIYVDLGDRVSEGELLLSFDKRDAKANLDAAQAALETNIRSLEKARAIWQDASSNLKRFTTLFSEGVVSVSQRDAVQTQYDVADAQLKQAAALVSQAKAQLEIAKKRLSDMEINAPISGEIKKRFVSSGEALKDKTPLFILVKNNPLKFQGVVPESFARDLRGGQNVAIHIDAFPDRVFSGSITRISPSIDVQTRMLSIEAKAPNPDNVLKSGYFARAIITTKEEKNVPFVPENAVYSFAGINKVYVIKDGTAGERQVKTGRRDAELVEIVEGVKPGETVAITGLDQLFEGAKVEVK